LRSLGEEGVASDPRLLEAERLRSEAFSSATAGRRILKDQPGHERNLAWADSLVERLQP
jgi:hypothetical protein